MIFSGMNIKEDVGIKIDGVNIDRVYHTKFLGVEIDCKLRWREHVNNIQTKIAKNISGLYKMKFLLDSAILFTLYQTIILPSTTINHLEQPSMVSFCYRRGQSELCTKPNIGVTLNLFFMN